MSLTLGTKLGPYEVLSALGAGGMGEVYRARDTKLNREVAIKVLPDRFASDAERLARFTREAQTLAALNHPNIAHIRGLEDRTSLIAEFNRGGGSRAQGSLMRSILPTTGSSPRRHLHMLHVGYAWEA